MKAPTITFDTKFHTQTVFADGTRIGVAFKAKRGTWWRFSPDDPMYKPITKFSKTKLKAAIIGLICEMPE